MGFAFEHLYQNTAWSSPPGADPALAAQSLGTYWRHSYYRRIKAVASSPSTPNDIKFAWVQHGNQTSYFFAGALLSNNRQAFTGRPEQSDRLNAILDTNGAIIGWEYWDEEGTYELYVGENPVQSVRRDGRRYIWTNGAYGVIRIEDASGHGLGFRYDALGRLATLIQPDAQEITYKYSVSDQSASPQLATDNLISVTYPDQKTRTYAYGEAQQVNAGMILPHALTGIDDENGTRFASFRYNDAGCPGMASATEHAGGVNRYSLTAACGTVISPLGTQTRLTYETIAGAYRERSRYVTYQKNGKDVTDSTTTGYDANGNISSRTDFNGNVTSFTYDLARNLETKRVEASGKPESRTISTAWHAYWRLPIKVAEPKKLTTWVYNGDTDPSTGSVLTCAPSSATVPSITGGTIPIGVLCKKTEQATTDVTGSAGLSPTVAGTPRTWVYTYNAFGQVLTTNGPRTDVSDLTTYTYYDAADADLGKRGNLATITNAAGHVTQITSYDLNGNPLTVIDPNGVTTTLTYDPRQRLTSRKVGSELTSYQYDGVGQLLKVTLPDGRTTAYTWDAAHRLTDIADALGNSIHYSLDAMGNRTKEEVKDPAGQLAQTRQHVYDALSRLAQDIGAQNQITAYEYDANGNRTKVTDPLSHSTVSTYDALNRLIQLTDPGTGQIQLAYDGQDRLTQVTDPRTLKTIYTVDGLGNRTQQQSPDTGTTVSTYDAAGNELTRKDAKNQTTTTAFDALNRPTLVTYPDGNQVNYIWDSGTNGKGRLTQIDELTGSTVTGRIQSTYDALGRVLTETRSIGGAPGTAGTVTHTLGYTWSNGQLTGQTLASGKQLTYTRNGAGQITQISLTDPVGGTPAKTVATAIAYHPFGGIKTWTDGAGQIHNRPQDQDGRTTGYTLGTTNWLISYDTAGRITGQVDGSNAANSALYGYDPLDRLTSATLPATTYGYGYDATGNRTSQTLGASTRTYVTDPASNRLQSVSSTPPTTYAHDANGSITGDGSNQFAYDGRNRLVSVTTTTGTTTYRINALGQRVRKTTTPTGSSTPSSDTLYHYDLAGHLVAESDATGQISREYLWLEDTPLAVMQ